MKDKIRAYGLPVLFWIAIWYLLSYIVSNEILLPKPHEVIIRLVNLAGTSAFWSRILNTTLRIMFGCILGIAIGILLGVLSYELRNLSSILQVFVNALKSVPVAALTIFLLIFIKSDKISIILVVLVVIPGIYENCLQGLKDTDEKLLEMAEVYRVPKLKIYRYIYYNQLKKYLKPALLFSIGFAWKAGVSGEILSQPINSIGSAMLDSKRYLEIADLLAYTVVVIIVSIIFQKIALIILGVSHE